MAGMATDRRRLAERRFPVQADWRYHPGTVGERLPERQAAKLWQSAVKVRNNTDAAEYKQVVLGLIFLKYISDAFEEHQAKLREGTADPDSEWYVKDAKQRYIVLEDRDEYLAVNVLWVPKEARWSYLKAHAKQPTIGKLIDDAMAPHHVPPDIFDVAAIKQQAAHQPAQPPLMPSPLAQEFFEFSRFRGHGTSPAATC
jgi:hypothetical protein